MVFDSLVLFSLVHVLGFILSKFELDIPPIIPYMMPNSLCYPHSVIRLPLFYFGGVSYWRRVSFCLLDLIADLGI